LFGYLDLAVFNGTNAFYEYLNNGDGTFRLQGAFVTQVSQITSMVAADVNHDDCIDLIFDGFNDANLYVWLSVTGCERASLRGIAHYVKMCIPPWRLLRFLRLNGSA
jgi:hypothetical protein